jgi:hypothetical protein
VGSVETQVIQGPAEKPLKCQISPLTLHIPCGRRKGGTG